MTPLVLRSAETPLRALGIALPGAGLAVFSLVSDAYGELVALPLLLLAFRMFRNRVIADEHGILDVRTFRSRLLPWDGITGFDVARPGGAWAGFCVRALEPEVEHDLLGLRAYSRRPSMRDHGELYRFAWALEELRSSR